MSFKNSMFAGAAALLLALSVSGEESGVKAASWQATGWGGGGFFWASAFHPTRSGVIYLGGDVNGFYKTEDFGKHWKIANTGISDYAIYSLTADAKNPDTVYVATLGGTCKSTDAGEHWEFLPQTGTKQLAITAEHTKSVRALAVDPSSGTVYAGTPGGKIFKTEDGGKTWAKLYELKTKGCMYSVVVSSCNPKLLLGASSVAGLLKSDDGGATWGELATPKSVMHAAFAPNDDALIYAACGKDGVMKSSDGGATWAAAGTGIDSKCVIKEIVIDPKTPENVYCIGNVGWAGTFYHSSDAGKTWTGARGFKRDFQANPTLPNEYTQHPGMGSLSTLSNLSMDPNDPTKLFLAGNWQVCLSSDAGKTWEERDAGADITCVSDIRFLDGKTFVTAMDEGLLVSADQGATWRQLAPTKYSTAFSGHQWRVLAWKKPDGATKILSTCSPWAEPANRVLISEDGGKSFTHSAKGLPTYRPSVNTMWGQGYARALAADPNDAKVLYVGIDGDPEPAKKQNGGGIFKSIDGGVNWKALPAQPGSRRVFYALTVDPTDSRRIFWGGSGANGGLYRSEDGGESWSLVFKNETWIFNMYMSPAGVVYCAGSNLWRSSDHGKTWENLTKFKNNEPIAGIEQHPKDENTLWISKVTWGSGSAGGVYKTTDGGKTWHEITGELPHRKPLVLRFNPETNELWAGGVGLYKLKQ